ILSRGFPKDSLGFILAATPIAALLLGLPLGKLADRIGHRKAMFIGLAVGLTGMLFEVVLQNQGLFFVMALVQGAGLMLYRVAQPPFIMSNSTQQNRTMFFSLNFSLMTFAGMVGSLVAGQLPGIAGRILSIQSDNAAAYQMVIIAGIVLGATSLIPIFFLKNDKPIPSQEEESSTIPMLSIKQLFSTKIIRQLFIINLIVGLGAALLIPYLNVFFREVHKMSDQNLGLLYSLSSLLVVIGSLSAPWMARVLRSKIRATNLTQGVSVGFLLLTGFSPILLIAQISFLLRTVFMQLSAPLLENFAMEVSPPGQQSTISGIRGMGWQIGQAAGLFISGMVQVKYGFSPLFITTAILYVISIFLTLIYFRPMEKKLHHAEA
ncbi:MAG: MFS transporter, partial [Anaerolineaceae bacterium]|nr:MFS transporter [Anaerolineaceae bacterium]